MIDLKKYSILFIISLLLHACNAQERSNLKVDDATQLTKRNKGEQHTDTIVKKDAKGRIIKKEIYSNGMRAGIWEEWERDESDTYWILLNYRNDTLLSKEAYYMSTDTIKVEEIIYKYVLRDTIAFTEGWYVNGSKFYTYTLVNNTFQGLRKVWHKQGEQSVEEYYKDGKLEGSKRVWNSNGILIQDLWYKDGNPITVKEYNDYGRLEREREYEGYRVKNEKEFDPETGKLKVERKYQGGKLVSEKKY